MVSNREDIGKPNTVKVRVPKITGHIIRRQRLLDLLHQNLNNAVITMSAPPGYGKTTLLIDFCHDLDIPICWYSLDHTDTDLVSFISGILNAVRLRFPEFGQKVQSLLMTSEGGVRFFTQLASALVHDITNDIPDYFLVVLDDYHMVESSNIGEFLNKLLEQIPENCHLLISSRTAVDIPIIHKLVIHGQAYVLDTRDLAFTPDEIIELLSNQQDLKLNKQEIQTLTQENEGWIVGILLQVEHLRSGGQLEGLPALSREDIFSYLTSDIYDRLPPELKDFLLKSSILHQIDPDLCNRVLDIKGSEKLLREIQRRNLFITSIITDKPCYRYHPLFRDFLRSRLYDSNLEEYYRLNTRAARIYENEHLWLEAISHFYDAQKYLRVKHIIRSIGQEMIDQGKWHSILKWIQSLPQRYLENDNELQLFQAQCLVHTGQIDAAIHILNHIRDPGDDAKSLLLKAKVLSWRSAAYRLAGNLDAALVDIKTALVLLKKNAGPSENMGDAFRRLGTIYFELGNLSSALKYLKQALKRYSLLFAVEKTAAVHNTLGVVYQEYGDLTQSSMHLNLARQGLQKVGNYGTLASVMNNLGLIYQCQGDFDQALKIFRAGLDCARESGYKRMEACILISIADLLRDSNLYDEAVSLYEEGLKKAEAIMENYYMICALAGIGETRRLQGFLDKAEISLKHALSLAGEYRRASETARISVRLGIIEYQRGEYSQALSIFKPAIEFFTGAGEKEALARTCIHMAQALFLSKRYTEAKAYLLEAARLTEQLGYDHFLSIEGKNTTLLLQYAVTEKVGGRRFQNILEFVRNNKAEEKIPASPDVKTKKLENAKPIIEVYAFSEPKVIVNSKRINDSDWRSSRALEMFFYLLTVKTPKTREQITTEFWPDLSPAKGISNFHISLYRVRQALFPGIVFLQEGRYQIAPDIGIWFDVNDFLHKMEHIKEFSSITESKVSLLQKAADLYKGPFLSNVYSDWADTIRNELEIKYLKALKLLARWYYETADYPKALNMLEKILDVDPYQDEIFTEIEGWNSPQKTGISVIRELKRYYQQLSDIEKTNKIPIRLINNKNGHATFSR